MKQKLVTKMFISAKKYYKLFASLAICTALWVLFIFAKKEYGNPNFGNAFGDKVVQAEKKLMQMQDGFALCASFCNEKPLFMQSIVFPELMRYNTLKDGIETESLRTLYVQFGEEYANFSIGIFQMKPTFAVQVETKAATLLPDTIYNELQLNYDCTSKENIRSQRVERLQDDNWQLIYLSAFTLICNKLYKCKMFATEVEKLQYYATVYNAGFDKSDEYISKKIKEANFYLGSGMPQKKFKYAAIAGYIFNTHYSK